MFRVVALALLVLSLAGAARAQNTYNTGTPVQGRPFSLSTRNSSVTLATSGFTLVLPASYPQASSSVYMRQELTVNNNNSSDKCYVFLGPATSTATSQISMLITAGNSIRREWPVVPDDAVQIACDKPGDSVYIDFQ